MLKITFYRICRNLLLTTNTNYLVKPSTRLRSITSGSSGNRWSSVRGDIASDFVWCEQWGISFPRRTCFPKSIRLEMLAAGVWNNIHSFTLITALPLKTHSGAATLELEIHLTVFSNLWQFLWLHTKTGPSKSRRFCHVTWCLDDL